MNPQTWSPRSVESLAVNAQGDSGQTVAEDVDDRQPDLQQSQPIDAHHAPSADEWL